MAEMSASIKAIQVKLETVKGTEVAGDTDLYVEELEIGPDEHEFVPRTGAGKYLGPSLAGLTVGRSGTCKFKAELQTTGSAGLNAALAILVQACGLAKTLEVYNTHSTYANHKTVSIDCYQHGELETLYGAMGNLRIVADEPGKRVMCEFEFKGLYKREATAVPAFAPDVTSAMLFGHGDGLLTLGGTALVAERAILDLQNEIVPHYAASVAGGIAYYKIANYAPMIEIDPEAASDDGWYADFIAGTEAAFVLGLADGTDDVDITCAAVQISQFASAERNRLRTRSLTCAVKNDSGNDAVTIAVT